MRTSIATVSMGGLLRDKLDAIAGAGFQGVELFETDVIASDRTPEQIADQVRDLGMEVASLQPMRDFEGMPEPHRSRNFDRARRKLDLARRLGTKRLLICSNVSPLAEGGIDRAAADLRELGDLAAEAGIGIGFEALAWGRHVRDYRDAWEIVRRADHPAVGIVLDSFHILALRLRPGFGRPADGHGCPPALAPLPLLPGAGRNGPARFHGGAQGHRLRRLALARGVL